MRRGQERQVPLPLGREEPFRGQRLLQPLDADERRAEPERLERERAQLKDAARLVELRPAVDVHLVPVRDLQPKGVERHPGHGRRQARPVLQVLEREEHALPAVLAAQLGDLALDPERGQARKPGADTAVERGDGVDLPVAVERRLDLHEPTVAQDWERLEQDLGGDFGRAAAAVDQVDREMEIGVARGQALGEGEWVAGLHQDVEPPALHLSALVLVPFVE